MKKSVDVMPFAFCHSCNSRNFSSLRMLPFACRQRHRCHDKTSASLGPKHARPCRGARPWRAVLVPVLGWCLDPDPNLSPVQHSGCVSPLQHSCKHPCRHACIHTRTWLRAAPAQPTSYTQACTRAACHHPAVPHCVPAGVYKATGRNDDNDNTRRPHVEEFARNDGILLADNPLLCLHRPRWSLMAVEGFGSVLGDGSALLRCVCGAPSRLLA